MFFVWISEQAAIISLYSINWLVCITETESVYCAVRTGSLYIIQVMFFVWISEQTAIISLYNINWLVCITETECVYCAVRTGSLNVNQAILGIYMLNLSLWRPHDNSFGIEALFRRFSKGWPMSPLVRSFCTFSSTDVPCTWQLFDLTHCK